MRLFNAGLASVGVVLLTASGLAYSAGSSGETSGALEEIVVTAQRRAEKLQDVPIAITVFNAEQLTARGITNVAALNGLAPNVQISSATGDNTGVQFSIRGAVTINPGMYWDPTVGVYLDGVYVAKAIGGIFDIMDAERIEVLNGPQGTLYGRNTLAGAVNLITRQPTGVFGGAVDVTYGNYNELTTKASLDLPKVGIASLSLGFRRETRDGVTKTLPGSAISSLDNRDQTGGRIALNLDFSDAFQAAYRFDYSDINQRPLGDYLARVDAPISYFPFVSGVTPLGAYVPQTFGTSIGSDLPQYEKSRVEGHSLTLRWDLDSTTQIKSVTGYRQMTWGDQIEFDGSLLPLAMVSRAVTFSNTSEELQIVGSTDRINYVGGVYYYKDSGYTHNPQRFFGDTFDYDSQYGYGTEARAGFGQVEFKATDVFTITAGLRYTSEKKDLSRYETVFFAPNAPLAYQVVLVPQGTAASQTFSAVTPLLTLAYKLSPEVNAYLKFSEGFKSGGFNGEFGAVGNISAYGISDAVANNVAETKTAFRPEKAKSVELGLKSTLAGGRLILNTDVFLNKVTDQQVSIFLATGAAASVVRNAAKATVYGFELSANWAPVDSLHVQANYGYLHAQYDSYVDAGVDVAGNRAFVHAPKGTFNLLVDAKLADTAIGQLHATADYSWTDSFYDYPSALTANYPNDPNSDPATASFAGATEIKSVGFLNGRLAIQDISVGSTKLTVSLWAKNLTNELHIQNNIDFGAGFGHLTPTYYSQPRTFGIQIHDKF